jgi:hypothetical protein
MKPTSRRLPREREAELSDLADAVRGYGSGLVDPLAIVRSEGITTSFGDYADAFDGLLENRSGSFHIYCNLRRVDRCDSSRARFTLGHELGHYFIDEHRNALLAGHVPSHPSFCDYQSPNLIELEADSFASCLLMPASSFRAASMKARKGLPGILDLAASYRTSITATAIRYLQMDLFPCVIVKWTNSGYAWKRLSASAYAGRLRKTIERVDRLPRDSPTARVLKGTATGLVEAGTVKSAWFPFVSASAEDNSLFVEQAISLGRFGVLTVLFPTS